MSGKKKGSGNALIDFTAGGIAGCCEALTCHPLDTIKVRMQLQGRAAAAAKAAAQQAAAAAASAAASGSGAVSAAESIAKAAPAAQPAKQVIQRGFIGSGVYIFRKDGIKGLYRGLGAVIAGITPKMAIRFWSFEQLKQLATPAGGTISTPGIFFSGIGAGIIEAVLVVNPTEVVKIRLQAQAHSMVDATDVGPKYRNALHCLFTVVREEGIGAVYRGVGLTAARQATNQGTNFTAYTLIKAKLTELQPEYDGVLPGWQTSLVGLTSGALGPMSNAPLDVIKTRMQRERSKAGESGIKQMGRIAKDLIKTEGVSALYRGITPRIMRVAPGQAVTFTVYEWAQEGLKKLATTQKPLSAA